MNLISCLVKYKCITCRASKNMNGTSLVLKILYIVMRKHNCIYIYISGIYTFPPQAPDNTPDDGQNKFLLPPLFFHIFTFQ